ncbi:hypothetical protein [Tersicoccus sp. Bi-70]|uniref:hypothetical protein n=1 Tax=Tersicoccus sp. Bi-70 TaxID=1897634 RepID=UPI0009779F3B|nr:hypothetical protein [Tersicoccus sp. Bi-70]OMH30622.1 hypothetical protein BGP79_11730 [Tersicoccus sp. Bi-70]
MPYPRKHARRWDTVSMSTAAGRRSKAFRDFTVSYTSAPERRDQIRNAARRNFGTDVHVDPDTGQIADARTAEIVGHFTTQTMQRGSTR